ncbi:MAG: nucleotidyl transferase AbiEii/AbiGii toxin family protein [Planctomycetes bacterium]|nr:nucleotidyl transferase AbiEii/AbiGii toxin family protein [Planctomycetota bacterium]
MLLSDLQARVLELLAGIEPPWTLTGGAALAGFHLAHRTTRDLDLFWHGRDAITDVWREVAARLRAAGLEVRELRSSPAFCSLQVVHGGETVVVDLVAEPVPCIEPPLAMPHRGVHILVDTAHEVLVNKLCALLHRSELRDLIDIAALVANGGDLERALADAPRKDGGFSALTLGFCLQGWALRDAARASGLAERAAELERFRDELLQRVAGGQP